MSKSTKSVSYIIAAYNEGNIIDSTIEYCIKCLSVDFEHFELILVNDGSKDDTGEKMDKLAEKYSCITVLHNLINLNFGASVQRGIVASKNDIIIYNAVDLPLDPNRTREIVDSMDDIDLLILEREEYKGTNFWRKVTSLVNRVIILMFFPIVKRGISDTNFIQVIRRNMISDILPLARGPIFTWPEMIFRAKYKGYDVKAMKIEYNPRTIRKGAFGKPHDIIWGVYEMLRFRFHKWLKKV